VGVERADLVGAAGLARISLTAQETARLIVELGGILAQIERLLATSVTSESEAPLAARAVPAGRSDEPGADPLHEELSRVAPEWRAGYFTVPRVLAP